MLTMQNLSSKFLILGQNPSFGSTVNITTTPSSSSITEVAYQSVVKHTEQNTVVNN